MPRVMRLGLQFQMTGKCMNNSSKKIDKVSVPKTAFIMKFSSDTWRAP